MAVVMLFVSIVLLLVVCSAEQSLFTLSYAAPTGHPQLVNANTPIKIVMPSPLHVADLYARIAGHAPLLLEGIHFLVCSKWSAILIGESHLCRQRQYASGRYFDKADKVTAPR
jgi:hypothetical protein